MGYLHIDNLYKAQEILEFKTCYALEKIHGTSAHIRWDGERVGFFAGGVSYDAFVSLFDATLLTTLFTEHVEGPCIVYGEAYGGKCQGMSKTYGPALRFVAFDVQINESWLSVPQAYDFADTLNLEFVDWISIPATFEYINMERDRHSTQAVRNGIVEPRIREGVVLRPPFEVTLNNGKRVIAKHKRVEFSERRSIPNVDPTKRAVIENADAVAVEWVTPMRLMHVLNKLPGEKDARLTGAVIRAMIEDVLREAAGEISTERAVERAIGGRAARLYRAWLESALKEQS